VVTPTFHGPVVICDVGANVNCRPTHLYQYGVMASVYAKSICGIKSPRVGLLSIGEEDAKGTDLVKQTRALLKADKRINFIGNVEGRDVFGGVVDVMVTEGFVGNVMLKLMEGMAGGVMKSMLKELVTEMPQLAEKVMRAAKAVAVRYDYNEYGGAPLLGVAGISIICHGASDYRGIKNAVRGVEEFSRQKVNEQIAELLADGAEDQ
ncbi:MAG: phosphate--acyl-ACP acyltransferase, partial [Planctomycetota bacterium]|nr:phosphate--acyl-ACP acyltransferase [Planctomycetota bacterium]